MKANPYALVFAGERVANHQNESGSQTVGTTLTNLLEWLQGRPLKYAMRFVRFDLDRARGRGPMRVRMGRAVSR